LLLSAHLSKLLYRAKLPSAAVGHYPN